MYVFTVVKEIYNILPLTTLLLNLREGLANFGIWLLLAFTVIIKKIILFYQTEAHVS